MPPQPVFGTVNLSRCQVGDRVWGQGVGGDHGLSPALGPGSLAAWTPSAEVSPVGCAALP